MTSRRPLTIAYVAKGGESKVPIQSVDVEDVGLVFIITRDVSSAAHTYRPMLVDSCDACHFSQLAVSIPENVALYSLLCNTVTTDNAKRLVPAASCTQDDMCPCRGAKLESITPFPSGKLVRQKAKKKGAKPGSSDDMNCL